LGLFSFSETNQMDRESNRHDPSLSGHCLGRQPLFDSK
jgi:hypothetical protein